VQLQRINRAIKASIDDIKNVNRCVTVYGLVNETRMALEDCGYTVRHVSTHPVTKEEMFSISW
jgi:hypothetical protein